MSCCYCHECQFSRELKPRAHEPAHALCCIIKASSPDGYVITVAPLETCEMGIEREERR